MNEKEFKKEIFGLILKPLQPFTAQYTNKDQFEMTLKQMRKWENEGKLKILEVREAQYII